MDEKERIRLILQGDPPSLRWFNDAHHGRLMAASVYFLGAGDPECEDIVQETLMIGFKKLADFEPRSSLYTWLAHICINLCHERMRARKRTLLGLEADIERLLQETAPTPDEAREKEHAEAEFERRRLLLGEVLPLLSGPYREILELRDTKGMSYAEIGLALRIPMGTVMSRLARCRASLKKLIESRLEGTRP
jgi:RNA polymerase sigma-70 factor (ECF subfamily)